MSPQEQTLSVKINKAAWALGLTIITVFGGGAVFIVKGLIRIESRFAIQDEKDRSQDVRDNRQEQDIKDVKSDVKYLYTLKQQQ